MAAMARPKPVSSTPTGRAFIRLVLHLTTCLILGTNLLAFAAPQPSGTGSFSGGLATVSTPDGLIIYCEIADTPAKRSQGLMFRTRMAPDRGMLFTFPEFQEPGYWTFWMKNTKMPLDILWLDQDGTIVHIERYVPVCTRTDNLCPRYRPKTAAVQVLELGAGQAATLNLNVGTQLTIELPK
ncbi:MAG: DUF192 domain-containing protein [Nitrospira sp. SB0677_bin_15]|nr:DUF192 domain-containing protein [Nitrospira sp. SB0667_bin_9]MYD31553.1 DUF192 domain-containing protein [Nitrospira sp. SB0661_bin_20]MYG41345.1 DUF192 domain-containing protein [Nitrospira sp. SB0677_bin_15]MYH02710.1 DUF192 domain-containing protein [Nitrospira sp. SB0675_bin_23]MYJ22371.1 DUF192 domain-containing protein [Nitrospira sp. SB0673_bin_12]